MKQTDSIATPIAFAAVVLLASATTAHAYVGPGVATGTIVVVLSVVGAVFLWTFALVWYPIKRVYRRLMHGWRHGTE